MDGPSARRGDCARGNPCAVAGIHKDTRSRPPENDTGSARADEGRRGVSQLIGRCASQLSDGLGGQIQTVDIALADQPSIRIARQAAVRTEVAVCNEILRLAGSAEPKGFELHQKDGENAS